MQERPGGAAEGFGVWWAVCVAGGGGEGFRDGAGAGGCGCGGGGRFGLFGQGAPGGGGGAEAASIHGKILLVREVCGEGMGEGVRLSVFVEDDSVGEFGHACGDGVIFCCRCWSGLLLGGG